MLINGWKFLADTYSLAGLVHKNDMSASRVDNPSEIIDVGEKVWIKVIGREVSTQHKIHLKSHAWPIGQKHNELNT